MDEHPNASAIDRPSGSYRSVVTWLEMRAPPAAAAPAPPRPDVAMRRWQRPATADYLDLFHRVGDPWLWHGRLALGHDEIERLLRAPDYEVWRLWSGEEVAGLGELNRSRPGEVKLEYFGLVPGFIGAGLGGWFLRMLVHRAWREGVERVWLHTCSEDHPDAVAVYRRVGFEPYAREVEWVRDPRLRGLVPRDAGPHVPLAE
ncbi:MAG: GNAT family N-acetyltransferase [Halofilum sp. (in: g-proteobacteria)]|nr:GNAT family N-acetyltransferase [Halofilum sp. (in: g-proteobacteria)]